MIYIYLDNTEVFQPLIDSELNQNSDREKEESAIPTKQFLAMFLMEFAMM